MSNELDELFDQISTDPTLATPAHIDAVIYKMRKARADWEAGVKPKKEKGPTVSLDSVVTALTNVAVADAPAEPVQKMRRF